MEAQVFNIQGKALRKVALADAIFAVEMKEGVLHDVVKAYRANRRQGTHATKTRAFVSGGGKKPFKQKGTGNARQGSSRSPLMPGGAVTHGPQPRDYRQALTKKFKQLALRIALSDKAQNGKLIIVDDFALSGCKTKHIVKALASLKAPKALLSDERKDDFLYKSARNIYGAAALPPSEINAENVLRYESLVISETALNTLTLRLSGPTKSAGKPTAAAKPAATAKAPKAAPKGAK